MTSRGIRNNNPGNLERNGITWEGLSEEQTDSRFCQFDSMVYGCRSLIKTLMTYVNKRKCRTIRDIINRWAPPAENNTEAYIKFVSKTVNKDPNIELAFKYDKYLYLEIAKAIALYENGNDALTISDTTWNTALGLCLKK